MFRVEGEYFSFRAGPGHPLFLPLCTSTYACRITDSPCMLDYSPYVSKLPSPQIFFFFFFFLMPIHYNICTILSYDNIMIIHRFTVFLVFVLLGPSDWVALCLWLAACLAFTDRVRITTGAAGVLVPAIPSELAVACKSVVPTAHFGGFPCWLGCRTPRWGSLALSWPYGAGLLSVLNCVAVWTPFLSCRCLSHETQGINAWVHLRPGFPSDGWHFLPKTWVLYYPRGPLVSATGLSNDGLIGHQLCCPLWVILQDDRRIHRKALHPCSQVWYDFSRVHQLCCLQYHNMAAHVLVHRLGLSTSWRELHEFDVLVRLYSFHKPLRQGWQACPQLYQQLLGMGAPQYLPHGCSGSSSLAGEGEQAQRRQLLCWVSSTHPGPALWTCSKITMVRN